MKKMLSVLTFLSVLASQPVWAAESKAGGLELSGNVDTVVGYQHDDSNANGTFVGGQLGQFRGNTAPSRDTFNFYIDQIELDLNKTFGENIRIRADLDFGRFLSGSGRNTNSDLTSVGSNFELEQGYITVNIFGSELLFGRFNVPIGYYVVDRADNPTISFSSPFNYLTPTNATGMKFYHTFGEHFDWHVYVVNRLDDCIFFGAACLTTGGTPASDSAIPSYGTRFGFNFGKEDTKSTVGISYAGGPERGGQNAHLTHIIDLDFAIKITPKFFIAGEGIYRQDNVVVAGTPNDKAFGGFIVADWALNDTWSIFFRYGFLQDRTGFYTLNNQNIHDFALGAGYNITEGAKMKIEYSPTIFDPRTAASTSLSHGFALEFAYNF
jgi:hypothetical protein